MTLKEKLKPQFMLLVDRALAATDFPWVPDWFTDPICRAVAEALYDKYIDELAQMISEVMED